MSEHDPFLKEEVVADYLSSLLSDPDKKTDIKQAKEQQVKLDNASKLLAQAAVFDTTIADKPEAEIPFSIKSQDEHQEIPAEVENRKENNKQQAISSSLQARLGKRFQALFFDVAGMTLAVPLVELGGIHQITSISHLVGKPAWFKGVMIKGEEKINCVDSAHWIMPEQYSQKLKESINYQYLVMLNKTYWGLMSESLINTVELNSEDVKWRTDTSKRPWLAGMVKEKMCALIDVYQFVEMLESKMPQH